LYGSVAGRNQFRFFLVVWGNFEFEEVVNKGESIAVPVKVVEGSRSAFLDSSILSVFLHFCFLGMSSHN